MIFLIEIDLELESQVLAAMMDNKELLDLGITAVKEDHFSDSMMRSIFRCIKQMYEEDKHIDPLTVYKELGELVKGRGVSWMSVKESFYSKGTFDYTVKRLEESRKRRLMQKLANDITERISKGDEIEDVVKAAEDNLFAIGDQSDEIKIVTPKQHAERMLDTLSRMVSQKSNGGLMTRYAMLNYALNGGMLPGQLIILAAQTGKGKTAFSMNILQDVSIVQKQPAAYINTEMNDEQLDCRLMAMNTPNDIYHSHVASGKLAKEEDFNRIVKSLDRISTSNFYSVTLPNMTINTLLSTARRLKSQTKMKLMVVDYVGRMDTTDAKLQEYQVFKNIAKKLKTLAQTLGITVIMLAQITEEEKLEGAKAMKNECDFFGYLREMSSEEQAKKPGFNYYLVADKNRNGKRMKMPLFFDGEKLTFRGEIDAEYARMVNEQQEQRKDNSAARKTIISNKANSRRPDY